jgi:uncharacterized protein YdaU (DUF1376 family)
MPLYVADYLQDTGHLTATEHGAYLLLLMQAWTRDGALPADDKRLAAMARCSPKEWRDARDAVMAFFDLDGDCYRNPRLERERARAATITQERSKAGAIGAAKRWQTHGKRIAEPLANASQSDAPSPSPSQKEEKEREPTPSGSPSPLVAARPKSACGFDDFWAAYPRKVGKHAARRAWTSAMKRASVEEIAAGLNAAQWPTDRNFIPHPATWLNAGRWLDEPSDVAPEKPGKLDYLHGFLNGKDSLQ